jgi:hypothetical protein
MSNERINARAVADVIRKSDVGLNLYRIEVWGEDPHDYIRVYEIAAKSDNVAAREGIDRFVEEIGNLTTDEA